MTEYVVKIGFWLRAYDSVTVEADADAEAIEKAKTAATTAMTSTPHPEHVEFDERREGVIAFIDRVNPDGRESVVEDVAFDDDHAAGVAAGDVALGQVETVEHLRLLVDGRLGGVQVLRALVVVVQLARAEADRLTGDVADRPHQASAEAVVHAASLVRGDQPGRGQLLAREALGTEGLEHRVPALWGVADPEVRGGSRIEPALAEEAARGLGLG